MMRVRCQPSPPPAWRHHAIRRARLRRASAAPFLALVACACFLASPVAALPAVATGDGLESATVPPAQADPPPVLPDPGWRIDYVSPFIPWTPPGSRVPFEGADYGICQLEIVARTIAPDSMSLVAATRVHNASDLVFLEQAALLAHLYALRNRNAEELLPRDAQEPRTVEEELAAAEPSPERPVPLYLFSVGASASSARRGHYVLAVGRQTRGPVIAYTIRDPNRSEPGELLFDRRENRFRRYGPFGGVLIDRARLPEENRQWLLRLARSLLDTPGQRSLPLWIGTAAPHGGTTGAASATPSQIEAALSEPVPDDELPGLFAVLPADSGRRDVFFDPALAAAPAPGGADPQTGARWRMQYALVDHALSGLSSFVSQPPLVRTLLAQPIEALVGDTRGSLGPFGRISGFVRSRRDGRLLVLGVVTPWRPPVRTDWFASLSRISETAVPAIWFEPDGANPFGPQRVRAEGIPDRLWNSPLGEALYQGDLALKRIGMGEDRVAIAGFRPAIDLASEDVENPVHDLGLWLRPRRAPGLGAWTVRSADLEAVVFEERLAAFSGARELNARFLPDAPASLEVADRAARAVNAHYDVLHVERPYIADLQALAELRRLLAEFRARGITSPALAALAHRVLPRTPVPDSAPSYGPRVVTDSALGWSGGFTFLTGGVRLGGAVHPSDDIDLPDFLPELRGLFETSPSGLPPSLVADLRVPGIIPLASERAARLRAWLETHKAIDLHRRGQTETALAHLERVAERHGTVPELHAWRGILRLERGGPGSALPDLNEAIATYPELLAVRARVRAFQRDTAGAVRDVTRAVSLFPDRPEVRAQEAWVRLMTRDERAAERALAALAALDPTSSELVALRAELAYQRRLGPAAAARHVREVLETPREVARLLEEAYAAMADRRIRDAIARGEAALEAARRHALVVSVPQPHLLLEERCRFALAGFLAASRGPGDADSAVRLMAELAARNPRAASWRIFQLEFGERILPLRDQVRLWEEAAARARNPDPFGRDLEARRGVRLLAEAGYRLMDRLTAALDRDTALVPVTARFLDRLLPMVRNAPEGRMVSVWKNVLAARTGGDTSVGLPAIARALRAALTSIPATPPDAGSTALEALRSLYAYPLTAPRDTRLALLMTADSAWNQLMDRLDIAWNTPEKSSQAARFAFEAGLIHCDRNLTRDLHLLLVRRLEYMALRQEPLTTDRALQVLDDAREIILRRQARRPFRREFLAGLLEGFYERLLSPVVEPEQIPEIRSRLARRIADIAPRLAAEARTPFERQVALGWIRYVAASAPGNAGSVEDAAAIVKAVFATSAALEAANAAPAPARPPRRAR